MRPDLRIRQDQLIDLEQSFGLKSGHFSSPAQKYMRGCPNKVSMVALAKGNKNYPGLVSGLGGLGRSVYSASSVSLSK